jgi:hypothetical protein
MNDLDERDRLAMIRGGATDKEALFRHLEGIKRELEAGAEPTSAEEALLRDVLATLQARRKGSS